MLDNYDEPLFLIGVVSKNLGIHPQTLRQYERENLVCPSRSNGRIRLFSQRDIDRIKLILRLTRDLGVNLAGVDIILRLKENADEMEQEIDSLCKELSSVKENHRVAPNRSLVNKKSIYDVIIFE